MTITRGKVVLEDFQGVLTDIRNGRYLFDYGVNYNLEPEFYRVWFEKNDKVQCITMSLQGFKNSEHPFPTLIEHRLKTIYDRNDITVRSAIRLDLNKVSDYQKKYVKTTYFHFYKRNKLGKVVFSHSKEYYLHPMETPEMALFKLGRMYPHLYIKQVSKSKEDMDKRHFNLIKELRKQTSAGMDNCKEAITKAFEGDNGSSDDEIILKATGILNEKKQVIASKKSSNEASQFIIKTGRHPFHNRTMLIKFGCESDQGLKLLRQDYNEDLDRIAQLAVDQDIEYAADLLGVRMDEESLVEDVLNTISGTLSEKVTLVGVEVAEAVIPETPHTRIMEYVHTTGGNDKAAAAIIYQTKGEATEEQEEIVRKVSQQLSFNNPLFIKKNQYLDYIDEVEAEEIKKRILSDNKLFEELTAKKNDKTISVEEKNILSKLKFTKDDFMDRKIQGALEKFRKEVILEEQEFLYDDPKVYEQAEKDFYEKNPEPDYDTLYVFPTIDPKLYDVTEKLAVSDIELAEDYAALSDEDKEKVSEKDFIAASLEIAKEKQDQSPEWGQLVALQKQIEALSDKKTKHIKKYAEQKNSFITNKLKAAKTTVGKYLEENGITIFDAVSF